MMPMRATVNTLPIALNEVSLRASNVTVLDSLSVTIPAGAPTMLIGPNGSGKTTLLRLLMGLVQIDSGHVVWGGHSQRPPDRCCIMFQRPTMLRRSAGGNIRYALDAAGIPRAEHDRRTTELLALVGLSGLERRPARRLSGGEQQRLALARALAGDPQLLLLDEPTASLDPAAIKAIEDIVRSIAAHGVKVVMATHDLSQVKRIGGDVVILHRGRVIESGPVADVFAAPRSPQARQFIDGELLI